MVSLIVRNTLLVAISVTFGIWLYEKGNYDDLRRDLQYVQWDTFNICLIFLIYLKLLDPTELVSAFLKKERPF